MLKNSFNLSHFGISDPGLLRPNNEDFWLSALDGRAFVLADGMGGHKAGEVASHFAVTHFAEQLEILAQSSEDSIDEILRFIKRALVLTNQYVWDRGQSNPLWFGMGCTLTSLLFVEDKAVFGHIGDSALFHFRDNLLRQLSEEHTKLIKETMGKRRVLTRAVGVHSKVQPQVSELSIKQGDRLLLCSDGLTLYLKKDELNQILSLALDIQSCAETLFSMAMQRGGGDNITIVIVEVGDVQS